MTPYIKLFISTLTQHFLLCSTNDMENVVAMFNRGKCTILKFSFRNFVYMISVNDLVAKIEEYQERNMMMFTRIMDKLGGTSSINEDDQLNDWADINSWSTPCKSLELFQKMNDSCASNKALEKKLVLYCLFVSQFSKWYFGFHIQYEFIFSKPGFSFVISQTKTISFDV